MPAQNEKPLVWLGSSKKDLSVLPASARRLFGYALHLAQHGGQHDAAKALRGFGSASVLEIISNDREGTYRAIYTIRFSSAVFVLHAYQKKSMKGIATPKLDAQLIRSRLAVAEKFAKEMERE